MRVTHVISNLEHGGAEVALCALLEAQAGSGIAHTVVSMVSGGGLVPRFRAAGAQVLECGLTRSIRASRGLSTIGRAIQQSAPDVVQGWMYHGNVAASACQILGFSRRPLIWGVRQSVTRLDDDVPLTRLLILTGPLFSVTAKRVVYNSLPAAVTHEQLRYPRAKRVVIPNGVDCERFRPRFGARKRLIAELGISADAILVGRVARYAPMKDFDTLFAAFALIRAAEPRAQLLLVGDGMKRDNAGLMGRWAAHGATQGVHFLGHRADIEALYPALDALISTSRSNEGFANVVFEAIASGCPVVSTDVGNSKDIRELQGMVVAPGDVEALSKATLRVLDMSQDARECYAQTARILLQNCFGLRAYAEAYFELWRSTIAS
jgi:glycosyltransferase involved in cell wall biosynthesis